MTSLLEIEQGKMHVIPIALNTYHNDHFSHKKKKTRFCLSTLVVSDMYVLSLVLNHQTTMRTRENVNISQSWNTVRKTASIASLSAATTFAFFSLNFSSIGDVIMGEYCMNFLRNPVANSPIHLAARATTMTFASLATIWRQKKGFASIKQSHKNKNKIKSSWSEPCPGTKEVGFKATT